MQTGGGNSIRAILLLICAVGIVSGQSATPTPPVEDEVIRVETELIDVPVQVLDKTGKPILGLSRNSFIINEDGKPQEIAEFSTTAAPMEVALLLDTSGSTRAELNLIRRAAQHFIDSLREGDRVAIISFRTNTSGGVAEAVPEIVQATTGDRVALSKSLENVGTSNGTPYYDALVAIVEKVFGVEPNAAFRGRRALVALTDGVDSTSATDFSEPKEILEQAGIANYFIKVNTRPYFEENLLGDCQTAIRFSRAQIRRYYGGFGAGSNVERAVDFCQLGEFERLAVSKRLYEIADGEMSELADRSGGRVFPIDGISGARLAFRQVAAELGTMYSIGYYSTNEAKDGKFRSIKVTIKGVPDGAQIRAREGYTASRR